jgi:glycosyltransferase involved in cell wall biosynthesis
MEILVLLVYATALLLLFLYNFGQLSLIITYLRSAKKRRKLIQPTALLSADDLPLVTIQLPVYNELYVVERLIDAVARIQYPKDKLDIQLLDDSTDETVSIIAEKVAEYKRQGFAIDHIRRPERTGFKAGALGYGLTLAKGELIAIFDADFVPDPDFLLKTIPHFSDPQVGIVQTRWEHLNENFSLITQLQAFGLNAHFTVEQSGRYAGGYLANFNGTGGVWMKGAAECARKLFVKVIKTPGISLPMKLHAFFHLFSSATFILVLVLGVLSVPLIYIRSQHPEWEGVFMVINLFQFNLIILITFYGVPIWFLKGTSKAKLIWYFPMYSSLMMGLSLHNTIAVVEGYIGRKTPFVRTPKFNVKAATDSWAANKYINRRVSWLTIAESALTLYFLGGLALAVYLQDFRLFFLHIMLMVGFGMVAIYSLIQAVNRTVSVSA